MKNSISYNLQTSTQAKGTATKSSPNEKWPALKERTTYHNLTIGLKDKLSFAEKKYS